MPQKWYEHLPETSVTRPRHYRLIKQFQQLYKKETQCLVIDLAIPDDNNLMMKVDGKLGKYKDLEIELDV